MEISDEQHEALELLARRRGLRGFSRLVQEAIDQFPEGQSGEDLDAVLSIRGSLSDEAAERLERRITELWSTWPSPQSSPTPTS